MTYFDPGELAAITLAGSFRGDTLLLMGKLSQANICIPPVSSPSFGPKRGLGDPVGPFDAAIDAHGDADLEDVAQADTFDPND